MTLALLSVCVRVCKRFGLPTETSADFPLSTPRIPSSNERPHHRSRENGATTLEPRASSSRGGAWQTTRLVVTESGSHRLHGLRALNPNKHKQLLIQSLLTTNGRSIALA